MTEPSQASKLFFESAESSGFGRHILRALAFLMGMTYEQEAATKSMLRVYNALQALRDTATDVKAIHFSQLSPEQQAMIDSIRNFVYADHAPKLQYTADGKAWRFQNFFVPKPNQ